MTYYLPLADGSFGSFEDDVPREVAHGKAWRYNNPLPPPPPVEKPWTAFGAGVDDLQGALYSTAEGVARAVGLDQIAEWARKGKVEQARQAKESLPDTDAQSFTNAESLTDYFKAATQGLTRSLPSMLPMAAAAVATRSRSVPVQLAAVTTAGIPVQAAGNRNAQETEQIGRAHV